MEAMRIYDPDNPEAQLSQLTEKESKEVSEFYANSKSIEGEQVLWNGLRESHPDWSGRRIRNDNKSIHHQTGP